MEAVIPPVDQPYPAVAPTETSNQTFVRILSYVQIDEAFVSSIPQPLRIRNFRLAMILDETQKKQISKLAKASEDAGMYTDSVQFFKLP